MHSYILMSEKVSKHSFLFCRILLFCLLARSYLGTLDYAPLRKVVTPSNKVKKIQHLEGGIIRSILVREGQNVSSGEPLIELEATRTETEFNELNALAALRIIWCDCRRSKILRSVAYSVDLRMSIRKVQKALELFGIKKAFRK